MRLLLFGCRKGDGHVACPLADPGRPAERARTVALERRSLVDEGLLDPQLVGEQLVLRLRVRDARVEELQHVPRGGSRRVKPYGTGLVDALAANVVDHEPGLAGRAAHV